MRNGDRAHSVSRAVFIAVAALFLCMSMPFTGRAAGVRDGKHAADFDQLWRFLRDRHADGTLKRVDWECVRARYAPLAAGAPDARAFIAVLEAALDELYDAHSHLTTNLSTSWRLPPHDLWAEWRGSRAVVVEVRRGSAAERAGVLAGDVIVEVDGIPVAEAAAARRPRCVRAHDREADEWALRALLAGRRDRPRELLVAGAAGRRRLRLEEGLHPPAEAAVSGRLLEGGVGYIRIASFGDASSVEAFDRELERFRGAPALVIDVRDNPGGDTAVARPIMGRLIDRRRQYAWMRRREGASLGPRWAEYVDPRGPWTYRGRVAVVVNHFSESMAEGFAMGLDGMGRATVVGTRMGGLGAGVARETLAHSGIGVQISAEPVYHVRGASRSSFRPRVVVDLTAVRHGGDAILEAALRHFGVQRR